MKLTLIGAGRMGIRHIQGAMQLSEIQQITIVDIKQESLDNAKNILTTAEANPENKQFDFILWEDFAKNSPETDIIIDASTAQNRLENAQILLKTNCKHLLVEKPLGQSQKSVQELITFFENKNVEVVVNLNMRLYESFNKIRTDLQNMPQLKGFANISVNTGTIGIGANGIHYLDLCLFILDANRVELVAGEIDEILIPSGRGANFGDFGGWATIKFYNNETYKGRLQISISSQSTAFGGWEIIAPHGKIQFNEIDGKVHYQIRKEDSIMPISRYFADYQPTETYKFETPFLGDLTKKWLEALIREQKQTLPYLKDALVVHNLMFDWLNLSKTHKDIFPIT